MAKVLTVDYAQMGKLRDTLEEASTRAEELGRQIFDDVQQLQQSWKGANSDAFQRYFFDRAAGLRWYTTRGDNTYLGYQADWVNQAMQIYEALESDIDAHVKRELGAG